MLVNSSMWAIFRPRRFLPGNKHICLDHDGVTETEGEGWKDDRNVLLTFLDPFDTPKMMRGVRDGIRHKRGKNIAAGISTTAASSV